MPGYIVWFKKTVSGYSYIEAESPEEANALAEELGEPEYTDTENEGWEVDKEATTESDLPHRRSEAAQEDEL